jgi:hypothetical protein
MEETSTPMRDQLKSFAKYVASLWGILSALTLSFPLLNNLLSPCLG